MPNDVRSALAHARESEPRLPELEMPLFVLWGRHDRLLDVSTVDWGDNLEARAWPAGATVRVEAFADRTFRGVVDKISYLRDLGVTAVELMPVTEFDETDTEQSV